MTVVVWTPPYSWHTYQRPKFKSVLESGFYSIFNASSVRTATKSPQTPWYRHESTSMGAFSTLIDAVLFFFFLVISVAVPLIDGQTCLPINYYPEILVDIKKWYSHEYGDYLVAEKPAFFVGLVWLELLFQWPLAIVNLYAISASKSWYRTTCLISGVSTFTSMVCISNYRSLKMSLLHFWIQFFPDPLRCRFLICDYIF